jgi:hypothetical protein
LENFIPLVEGGAKRMPGTYFALETKDSTKKSRLIPFQFSTVQSYVIEAGDQYFRFYKEDGQISTPDAYTKILLHCDDDDESTDFTDSSASPHTLTAEGDAQIDTAQKVFGTSSGLFDGNGDYVTIPDHADFNYSTGTLTWDTWIKFNAVVGMHVLYMQKDTTSGDHILFWQDHSEGKIHFQVTNGGAVVINESAAWAPSASTWYHLALIRGWGGVANDWAITINGTEIHTFTNSGTMPDHDQVVTLGGNLGNYAIDYMGRHPLITVANGANRSSSESKFGSGSWHFDGSDDNLNMLDHADWDLTNTTNYTISIWVKHTDHAGTESYISQYVDANNFWWLGHIHGSGITFQIQVGGGAAEVNIAGGEITDTNWHFITLCKVGTSYGVYKDGIQVAYVSYAGTDTYAGGLYITGIAGNFDGYMEDIFISHANAFSASPVVGLTDVIPVPTSPLSVDSNTKLLIRGDVTDFNGWIDEIRISKGIARWTVNFTSPTQPYPFKDSVSLTGGGGTSYEIVTPYLEADIFELKVTQSADTLYLVHPNYEPRKLTRTDHTDWSLDVISFTASPFGAGDYPGAVAFFEQRLCFGGSDANPQTIWCSVSGDYENMTTGTDDDSAIIYSLVSDKVDRIRWMIGQDYMMVGTVGGVWKFGATNTGDPLTISNVSAKKQISLGVKNVDCESVSDAILWVSRSGLSLRQLTYSWEADKYIAPDMTRIAKHIALGATLETSGIVDMDFQSEPLPVIWAVRADGQLLGMTYEIQEQIYAWFRVVTDGQFESVACISSENNEDQIWVIVNRKINGSDVRYVEYFKPMDFYSKLEDCFFLHCGLTWDGGSSISITGITKANPAVVTAAGHSFINGDKVRIQDVEGMIEVNIGTDTAYTVAASDPDGGTFQLSGIDSSLFTAYSDGGTVQKVKNSFVDLTHLQGKEVQIMIDGVVHGIETVTAGAITLDWYGNKIHVGLPFTSILEPMKLNAGSALGTGRSKKQRVSKIEVTLFESLGGQAGPSQNELLDLNYDGATDLFTGEIEFQMDSNWGNEATISIVQDDPLPMTVLSIVPHLSLEEG